MSKKKRGKFYQSVTLSSDPLQESFATTFHIKSQHNFLQVTGSQHFLADLASGMRQWPFPNPPAMNLQNLSDTPWRIKATKILRLSSLCCKPKQVFHMKTKCKGAVHTLSLQISLGRQALIAREGYTNSYPGFSLILFFSFKIILFSLYPLSIDFCSPLLVNLFCILC